MLIDILTDVIFYNVGYITIKVITWGRYPQNYEDESTLVILLGAAITIIMISFISVIFFG